jgi:EcsC protein family
MLAQGFPCRAGHPATCSIRPDGVLWSSVQASILRATMVAGSIQATMSKDHKSWLRRRVEQGLVRGLTRAYDTVKVNPDKFLIQVRAAYDLPITSFQGAYQVELGYLDQVAASIVRSSVKMAAVQGAGFGLGGLLTLVPDLGFLSAITMRTIQKLSLVYGFEFNTEDEMAELWIAAASAAGVDISRELLEKEVINRFVPRVIQRIAAQASGEVVEKWAGRLIPVASSLIGAGLNYYFVRTWGQRAAAHFRQRHVEMRRRMAASDASPNVVTLRTAEK